MQITPYLLKEAFLAKTHNLKHLTRHTNAVGIYHCSLLCSHSQISVRTDGRTDASTVTLRRMRRGCSELTAACRSKLRVAACMLRCRSGRPRNPRSTPIHTKLS